MFLAAQHELLLQIIERPHDDGLRMVLADRLAESADPLGELIIVQLALEQMLEGKASGDYRALKAREGELVSRYGAEWAQAAAPFARRITMKRGLPHTLRCTASALLDDGGLTVLAPIEQLELERVGSYHLHRLFVLPLLKRIHTLGLGSIQDLRYLNISPGPLPSNVTRLKLVPDGLRTLEAVQRLGLLEHVQELELSARYIVPQELAPLEPPAAPKLRLIALTGLPPPERRLDVLWRDALRRLTDARPSLSVVYRGIEYGRGSLPQLPMPIEPDRLDETPALAAELNHEPLGETVEGEPVPRRLPSRLDFRRLPDGALVALGYLDRSLEYERQPLALDAATLLTLAPHPHVLAARAYGMDPRGALQRGVPSSYVEDKVALRFEAWPARSLAELKLPVGAPTALALVSGIARGLLALRAGLLRQGLLGYPTVLSLDEVLVGRDGAVKLTPPFRHCALGDGRREEYFQWLKPLGHAVEEQREGTDDAVIELVGNALMHLLAGGPVSPRLRPSVISAALGALDPLVHGCLAPRRADRFVSIEAFFEAVNQVGQVASQDEVAREMRERQSS